MVYGHFWRLPVSLAVLVVTSIMGKDTDGCRVPCPGEPGLGGRGNSEQRTQLLLSSCVCSCPAGGAKAGVTAWSSLSPQSVLCPAQGPWRKCCMGTAVGFQLCGRSLECLADSSEELVYGATESAALQYVGHYFWGWCWVPGFPFHQIWLQSGWEGWQGGPYLLEDAKRLTWSLKHEALHSVNKQKSCQKESVSIILLP